MALSIKNSQADRLARELAKTTGESLTDAVINALDERLTRQRGRTATDSLEEELRQISSRCSSLPVLDGRKPDEILGYDEYGAPA